MKTRVLTWMKFALIASLFFLSTESQADVTWTTGTMAPGDYTASGIVTISGNVTFQPGTFLFTTLIVNSGTLSLQGNMTSNTGVIISAGTITVNSSATVSANGLGYGANSGLGTGVNAGYGGGAGYGGAGGASYNGFAGGSTYGNLTGPTSLGSGGGASTGGAGGGAMKLVATSGGTITVNGTLTVNGNAGTFATNYGGGGSGGSIWIDAGTFTGSTGKIYANGGNGATGGAGGGGGGRIYVSSATNSYSGTITVTGGTATSGAVAGSGGTILFVNSSTNDLSCTSAINVTLANSDLPTPMGGLTIQGGCKITTSSDISSLTSVTVIGTGGSTLTLNGNLSTTITGAISLTSSAVLTMNGNAITGIGYTITAANISVDATSKIIADGLGYGSDSGPGAGVRSSFYGGGGGYGGAGGAAYFTSAIGGPTYGNAIGPTNLGSGGASGNSAGGAGGGAIKLVASGTVTVSGSLSAIGSNGTTSGGGSGGGSGGSIWIDAGALAGAGSISVKGGNGASGGGGGGGGRIYLGYSASNSYSGTPTFAGGSGSSGSIAGSSGSFLIANSLTNDLTISASMSLSPGYYLFNTLTIASPATLTLLGDSANGLGVLLNANSITINNGAFMVADAQGYAASSGPGVGDLASGIWGNGGGYGGIGGKGVGGGTGGATYGSSTNPTDFGSGGGVPSGGTGGAGGGVIKLVVSGTLTVNGTLSSNGGAAGNTGSPSGGGSGGSVWINGGTIAGTGNIFAKGGTGTSGSGGGGAGGRIALSYSTKTFTGSTSAAGGGGGGSGAAGTVVTGAVGAPIKLGFTLQPLALAQAAVVLAQQPIISILDSNGNTVPSTNDAIVLTAFTDASCTSAASGALTGSTVTTNGMAWASGVSYSLPGKIYLKATSGSYTPACSSAILLGGAPATQLVFITQPSSTGTVSVNLAQQPVVEAQDSGGNTDYFYSGAVTLAAYSDSSCATPVGSGTLSGSSTNSLGDSTFTGVKFSKALTIYLKASSGSLTSACSASVTIASGPATKLSFTTQPSSNAYASVNFPQQPVVTVMDSGGNTVAAYSTAVTLTAYTNSTCTVLATGATLNGSATTVNGVASFSGENYTKPATIYLKASSGALTTDCSAKIIVTAGPATQLVFTVQPSSSGVRNVNLKQQPTVVALDAYNNIDLTYTTAIGLSAYTDSGCTTSAGGTVSGSATTIAGSATFTGVRYNQASTIYIKASSGVLTPGCSSSVILLVNASLFFRGF